MNSIISFGRELGSAALEEAATFVPGIACAAASIVSPTVSAIVQTALPLLSLKEAITEYRKAGPRSLNRTAKILYYTGMAAVSSSQALLPSHEASLALGAVAAATGVARLYKGFQQTKQGLKTDNQAIREKSLAKGLVSTISGTFNLATGLRKISSSLSSLKEVRRIKFYLESLNMNQSTERARFVGADGIPLFPSTIWGTEVDENLAKSTLAAIQKTSEPGVSFSGKNMLPWNPGGTCSARTFDFLARHAENCPLDISRIEQIDCIARQSIYYEQDGIFFQSRQAAFDTIHVNASHSDSESLKTAKMASLAAFHNLKIEPMTQQSLQRDTKKSSFFNCWEINEVSAIYKNTYGFFSKEELLDFKYLCNTFRFSQEELLNAEYIRHSTSGTHFEKTTVDVVNQLPFGRYLIRGLQLEDNHKMEHHGHSMALIKTKKGSFFFDPDSGANVIIRNVGNHVAKKIVDHSYWLTEFRIYKVFCGEGGCTNLAPEL